MLFHKHLHPSNFEFVKSSKASKSSLGPDKVSWCVQRLRHDVFRITVKGPGWEENLSQSELAIKPAQKGVASLDVAADLSLTLTDADGQVLLRSPAGQAFGKCGTASMFTFCYENSFQFYGMGEKMFPMERSGRRTNFWNTDVMADFDWRVYETGSPDPMYVSIPYLIVKNGNAYVGLLYNNPFASFISTQPVNSLFGKPIVENDPSASVFWIGSTDGQPDLFIIPGPSLADVTRKLQDLVGKVPCPPAWALGYHQSRWGYESQQDVDAINYNLDRYRFPCDAIWLDVDYMEDYRVFGFDPKKFPNVKKTTAALAKKNRHLVPLLDPGVKLDPDFPVFQSGEKADIWCKTPHGRPFVGLVWPGETVFPDFSIKAGRNWWAANVKRFASQGIDGCWLDLNDPSTGYVDYDAMLFDHGTRPHAAFHNQYALGMARASHEGFRKAHPNQRPFMLCRSGFTGSSKYTAIWTGDNISNNHYLRISIPCSLNLSLSGIPFNAPDMGGFGGDTSTQLMVNWYKCGFLFPLFRNHSAKGGMRQEPWIFDNDIIDILRDYTRLRYKFRHYLYNLFIAQEEVGDPILRPLVYEFNDTEALPLGRIDDQFMIGPAILQAPVVEGNCWNRSVVLPNTRWYSALDAAWINGGRTVTTDVPREKTPIYFREGEIVPTATGDILDDNRYDGSKVEFHIFLKKDSSLEAGTEYAFDDGLSFDYRQGRRSIVSVEATVSPDGILEISSALVHDGFGECRMTFILYDDFPKVKLNGKSLIPERHVWRLAGQIQKTFRI